MFFRIHKHPSSFTFKKSHKKIILISMDNFFLYEHCSCRLIKYCIEFLICDIKKNEIQAFSIIIQRISQYSLAQKQTKQSMAVDKKHRNVPIVGIEFLFPYSLL